MEGCVFRALKERTTHPHDHPCVVTVESAHTCSMGKFSRQLGTFTEKTCIEYTGGKYASHDGVTFVSTVNSVRSPKEWVPTNVSPVL